MWSPVAFNWILTCVLLAVVLDSGLGREVNSVNTRLAIEAPTLQLASVLRSVDTTRAARDDEHLAHLEERIVGGERADYKNHPYLLQLNIRDGCHGCGASIISQWWVVTAAHCLVYRFDGTLNASQVSVRAGAEYMNNGGRVHNISTVIAHNDFDLDTYDYDIALLKVTEPFHFGPTVQPVALPRQEEGVEAGSMAIASGWGKVEFGGLASPFLLTLKIPIVSQKQCRSNYRKSAQSITERMLCAGFSTGKFDTCQGDSGGPLIVDGKLVGVVSWGNGCALAGFPGVFTRVAKFRTWIKEKSGV